MKAGTEIKILRGNNKGCVGRISDEIPSNSRQYGKVPVIIGNKNQLVWVHPDSLVQEETPVKPGKFSQPGTSDDMNELADKVMLYLENQKAPTSDIAIALELDLSLLQLSHSLRVLVETGKIKEVEKGYYECLKEAFLTVDIDSVKTVNDLWEKNQGKSEDLTTNALTQKALMPNQNLQQLTGNFISKDLAQQKSQYCTELAGQESTTFSNPTDTVLERKSNCPLSTSMGLNTRSSQADITLEQMDREHYSTEIFGNSTMEASPTDTTSTTSTKTNKTTESKIFNASQKGNTQNTTVQGRKSTKESNKDKNECLQCLTVLPELEEQQSPETYLESKQLNLSKSTQTLKESCDTNSQTSPFTTISEHTSPHQENMTFTGCHSHAPEQATQGTETDLKTPNLTFGSSLYDASSLENLDLSLWNSLKDLLIADFERYLEDSEWQATTGKIRSFYHLTRFDVRKEEPDFLQLPTLTSNKGQTNRPAGTTKCDRVARELGIIGNSQLLSAETMAIISGFPPNWAKSLLESNAENPEDSDQDSSSEVQSSPNKQQSPSNESKPSTRIYRIGKQWLDPRKISIKGGTQSRVCDDGFEVITSKVQEYAEAMRDGVWDYRREPLPVAFVDSAGKFHAGDCHHRVSAAVSAKLDKILFDVRQGELIDAQMHSCQSNTDHGLQLRPKDQRRRIEMLLDLLETIDEARSQKLLDSIADLTPLEKANSMKVVGKWTARTCAKYLKMTENGYRTVVNIMNERETAKLLSSFKDEKYVGVHDETCYWEGRISCIDKRGIFISPMPWCPSEIVPQWVQPSKLEKLFAGKISQIIKVENAIAEKEAQKVVPVKPITSVKQEVKQLHQDAGIPQSGIPEAVRNEGFEVAPITLVSQEAVDNENFSQIIRNIRYFDATQLLTLQSAIASRLERLKIQESA